ncbi:MAG TPA: hypothetical protein VL402_01925 [Xanthobacteraceae bacterium]|jgi:hypothetical protein|nr:hypothetical protein [Xanthobacteraceae bacterium]
MAFKPNYGLQRADRNRAAQTRNEEKKRKKEEKSAQRAVESLDEEAADSIDEVKVLPDDEELK